MYADLYRYISLVVLEDVLTTAVEGILDTRGARS